MVDKMAEPACAIAVHMVITVVEQPAGNQYENESFEVHSQHIATGNQSSTNVRCPQKNVSTRIWHRLAGRVWV